MKSRNVAIAVILSLLGGVSVESKAQETIQALLKKCENMDSVTVSVIRDKDKETGKITRDLTNVSFKTNSNPALEKEFLAAFQKEEDKADRVSKNISNGKTTSMLFVFGELQFNYNYNKRTGIVNVNATNRSITLFPTTGSFNMSRGDTLFRNLGIEVIRRNNDD